MLVVIGILIALQIHNWNNQRLSDKQMTSFLIGIIDDLKSDTLQIENSIKYYKAQIEEKKAILQLPSFEEINPDTLFSRVQSTTKNYTINTSTFDKIRSTGITQISNNISLSKSIYNYYTISFNNLKDYMGWDIDESKGVFNYFINGKNLYEINLVGYGLEVSDTHTLLNFQNESVRKKNLTKLLSEPTARNLIKRNYGRKHVVLRVLEETKAEEIQTLTPSPEPNGWQTARDRILGESTGNPKLFEMLKGAKWQNLKPHIQGMIREELARNPEGSEQKEAVAL